MLSDRGVLVTYSAASGQPLAINELLLIGKQLTVKGFFLGHFDHMSKILPAQIEAAPLVASGALSFPSPRFIRCRKSRKPSPICSRAARS
jgi:NADPH:quinone reductase-like Zn-dependent oxidoreductase